jgi:hypothetical protein
MPIPPTSKNATGKPLRWGTAAAALRDHNATTTDEKQNQNNNDLAVYECFF